jgi:hypothetical protein
VNAYVQFHHGEMGQKGGIVSMLYRTKTFLVFRGLLVAQVHALFRIKPKHTCCSQRSYPCAVASWFRTVGNSPCPNTGMWIVEHEVIHGKKPKSIIHVDTILRGAHLIGIAGDSVVPDDMEHMDGLKCLQDILRQ